MTGTSIKRLRKSLGLSVEQMADVCAVYRQTIYAWESTKGKLPPMGGAQVRILELLKAKRGDGGILGAELKENGWRGAWRFLVGPA